jgi:hypothetical protein
MINYVNCKLLAGQTILSFLFFHLLEWNGAHLQEVIKAASYENSGKIFLAALPSCRFQIRNSLNI